MRYLMTKSILALCFGTFFVFGPLTLTEANADEPPKDRLGLVDDLRNGNFAKEQKKPRLEDSYVGRGTETNEAKETSEVNVSGGIAGMFRVLSIAIVLMGLAYALVMIVKRVRNSKDKTEEPGDLKLVESLWIGKGQRLMLLNVGGQQVLLGASGGSIQSLAVLEGGKTPDAAPEEKAANDDYFPSMLRSEMKEREPTKPTYGRTGRLETRDEETKPAPQVSNERVKQILKRLNHL
jgi:flagellar protein FliO/FliZ